VDIEPRTEEFFGSFEDARKFVVDFNERRRHSTPSQRGIAAAKLAKISQNDFKGNQWSGPREPNQISNERAAETPSEHFYTTTKTLFSRYFHPEITGFPMT